MLNNMCEEFEGPTISTSSFRVYFSGEGHKKDIWGNFQVSQIWPRVFIGYLGFGMPHPPRSPLLNKKIPAIPQPCIRGKKCSILKRL